MSNQSARNTLSTHQDLAAKEKDRWGHARVKEVLKTGRLRGKKQGKRWYIPEGNLQAYFEEDSSDK